MFYRKPSCIRMYEKEGKIPLKEIRLYIKVFAYSTALSG